MTMPSDRRWSAADRELEAAAAAVHQAYLDTCARLGWPVKPANQVPYDQLSEESKELDRASVRAVRDALTAAGWHATYPLIAARVREQVAEEIADAIEDNPGPDPSPARPSWWAGYVEAQHDAAAIARAHRTTPTLTGEDHPHA